MESSDPSPLLAAAKPDERAPWMPLRFLKARRVAGKIGFASTVWIALLAIASGVALWGQWSTVQKANDAVDRGYDLAHFARAAESELLQARRREKDFLLRWREEGFAIAQAKYAEANHLALDRLREYVQALDERLGRGETPEAEELRKRATAVAASADAYEAAFKQTRHLIHDRGFVDTGIEGRLRKRIHDVEETIGNTSALGSSEVTLLMLRRHEKDYLLRRHMKYTDRVKGGVQDLREQVGAAGLSETESARIVTLLDDYEVAFFELVEVENAIDDEIERFREPAAHIEDVVVEFVELGRAEGDRRLAAASERGVLAMYWTLGTFAGLLLLGVFVTFAVRRHLVTPLKEMTASAKALAAGATVPLKARDAPDLNGLTQAVNGVLDRAKRAERKAQKRQSSTSRRAAEDEEELFTLG